VGCKSDKSPAYSLTASEAIDTAWVRTASAASWRGRRVGRRRGAGFGSLNSVSGTERLGAKAGRGARDHVAHDMSGRRWPPEPQQADSPRRWRAILATLSCWRSPRVRRLFKLWRSMMIEQQADLEGFQAIIHEKTGMTRAEIDALDRESPEWEAYSQIGGSASRMTAHSSARRRGNRFGTGFMNLPMRSSNTRRLPARGWYSWPEHSFPRTTRFTTLRRHAMWNVLASVCAFLGVQFPPIDDHVAATTWPPLRARLAQAAAAG
jgi:hypothetical protein